jgi:hypothetical protein
MAKDREIAIRKLMDACDKEPELQAQLFESPKKIAAQHGVELEDAEVQQLQKVGALMRLVGEFKAGRVVGPGGPIYYPIDVWWKRTIFNHVISYRSLYNPLFHHIFDPIGYPIDVFGPELGPQFGVFHRRLR